MLIEYLIYTKTEMNAIQLYTRNKQINFPINAFIFDHECVMAKIPGKAKDITF